jgi:hypothetical protein
MTGGGVQHIKPYVTAVAEVLVIRQGERVPRAFEMQQNILVWCFGRHQDISVQTMEYLDSIPLSLYHNHHTFLLTPLLFKACTRREY